MKIGLSLDEVSLGGGSKFMLDLGRCLVAAGHRAILLPEVPGNWEPLLATGGLELVRAPALPRATFRGRARALADAWNRAGFDAIVVNVGHLNRLATCALHFLDARVPVMLVLHGDWESLYSLAEQHLPVWNCAVGVGPAVHARAAARFPSKPVFCVQNGVAIPGEAELRGRAEHASPLRLVFVGRLVDAHKGVFRLAPILAECRRRGVDVRLTVVGVGPDAGELRARFAAAGVSDLVEMAGELPPDEIPGVLRRHHVLLFPTNTEGMPLVVLEALASGCVPVVTRLPGITDVAVEDGVSGRLVEPGDVAGFAEQVAAMVDPVAWRAHSRAGAQRARMLFGVEAMGDRYLELIEGVARGACPLAEPYATSREAAPMPFTSEDHLPPVVLRNVPPGVLHSLIRLRHRLFPPRP